MGESIQEIKLSIPNKDRTVSSELTVRFVFEESGSLVRIEGTGPQHEYEGRLILKGTALGPEADHCVVCDGKQCFVEVPCRSCE
jgi:hypothetical protein